MSDRDEITRQMDKFLREAVEELNFVQPYLRMGEHNREIHYARLKQLRRFLAHREFFPDTAFEEQK